MGDGREMYPGGDGGRGGEEEDESGDLHCAGV